MTEQFLIQKATILFPITPATPETAVRHARRSWIQAMYTLQSIQCRKMARDPLFRFRELERIAYVDGDVRTADLCALLDEMQRQFDNQRAAIFEEGFQHGRLDALCDP